MSSTLGPVAAADVNNNDLIMKAQLSDDRDRALTIREAFVKYRTAMIWSMTLSVALVMDGFYVVIVSTIMAVCYCYYCG